MIELLFNFVVGVVLLFIFPVMLFGRMLIIYLTKY